MRLSHRLAIENPNIRSDMVEVTEFPDLAQQYQVMGVPLTVVNNTMRFEGGAPEVYFVPALMELLGLAEAETDDDSSKASE